MSSPPARAKHRLLVSICNVAANPRPTCLLALDLATGRRRWVDVGIGEPLVTGTGLTADDGNVYHVSVTEMGFATKLTVLDRKTLAVRAVHALPEVADAHSIVLMGNEVCVASTETDEILAYPLRGDDVGPGRVLWAPTDSHTDTHHVNSLAVVDAELFCSAFGPRSGESWSTATNGYVRNVSSGHNVIEGLRQPHTVARHDERLYFCNSMLGTLNDADGVAGFFSGYTRGLAFAPNGTIYVGTSLARRPMVSPVEGDLFANPSGEGQLHGRCSVVEIAPSGMRTEIGLAPMGTEVYDLLIV